MQSSKIKDIFLPFKSGVKRRAKGALKHDYIVPSGYYEEQWDWDGFFIGQALLADIPSEGIFLKNWVLNFVENSHKSGFTPGCITPQGRDKRLHHMKPFIAQGAMSASLALNEYDWLRPIYQQLKKIVLYRSTHLWNKKYDLGVWHSAMESGADNNVAVLAYPDKTVIGVDLNCYIFKEYMAMAQIALVLGFRCEESDEWFEKAQALEHGIELLWNKTDSCFYNLNSKTGQPITRVGFNVIHPFWAGIATGIQAKAFFTKYAFNKKELWSSYGIRSLSLSDMQYNNKNTIKPHSNWQGPIWPLVNYFYYVAFTRYGYTNQARKIADAMARLCINDIKKTGGMHENYHAKTGEPLAAPNFISWNLLIPTMH